MFFDRVGYWYFKNVIDEKFIKKLDDHAKTLRSSKGTIDGIRKATPKQKKLIFKKRFSDVKFISQSWVYDKILPFIRAANQNAGWNFEFNWCESAQYTTYTKNQYYGWHVDVNNEPYDVPDPNIRGKVRKLSCTLLLNDSSEYEGGEFEFDIRTHRDKENIIKVKELQNKGDLIVFPSFRWHRVKPITKGKRKSLVVWFIGPPFK